ncbi:hypothetical protein [Sphingobium sp. ZW T5_29]|uniref:hypothetical protein n=1 Tax=Sphingobium sp. ZW T5_29 TaxID=3378077 RepID=UPI0038549DD0
MTTPTNEELIAIWSKAVDTQMHFNEMSVKSRQLGLTFVTAALALGVVLMSQGDGFSMKLLICGRTITLHVAVLLALSAILGLQAVKVLDLTVYHRMLRGAVSFGEDFERNYMSQIFNLEKGMTGAISFYSRHDDAKVENLTPNNHYIGSSPKTAEDKIRSFYNMTTWTLLFGAFALFAITNLQKI